jgi:molecular chaperone GrpE
VADKTEIDTGDGATDDTTGEPAFRVEDRRHWTRGDAGDGDGQATGEPARPTVLDEYRQRAEAAERKLQDYIEAYKGFREEQEQVRVRLNRDMDRKLDLRFAALLGELLETLDHLDLALRHVEDVPQARPLAEGVALARNHFLATLASKGVERIAPEVAAFDPNEMEAIHVDAVSQPEQDGQVTRVLQPGYRLGEHLIRPARVAVGRLVAARGAEPDTAD